jgi:hypothetical protein
MRYAFLQYSFIFDPSQSWSHVYQFEKDLADFFAANGFEAELMKQVEGSSNQKVFILKKIEGSIVPTNSQPGRPITIPGTFKKIREMKVSAKVRDFKKGTFLPRKGYLKRG